MLNLDQAIAAWRAQLLAVGLTDPAVLDELEAHLREDFAREVKSGLDETQAFALVVERIGSGPALKVEFKKANFKKINILKRCASTLLGVVIGVFCSLGVLVHSFTDLGYHPFPHYVETAWWSDPRFSVFMVFLMVLISSSLAIRTTKQLPVVYWKWLCSFVGLSLGIAIIGQFALMCLLLPELLIFVAWQSDGVQGGLEAFPLALIFFAVACLITYFSWKVIRAGCTRLVAHVASIRPRHV